MSSENSKTSNSYRLILSLLKRSGKYVAILSLSICYTRKNMNVSYNNNKFKVSVPT